MLGCSPEGTYVASVHPEPWRDAVREVLPSNATERVGPRDGIDSPSHEYVKLHLEGSSVEPWSVPGSACVFGSANTDPEHERVYVALRDTADEPDIERTGTLLRLMLASGAD